MFAAGLVTKFQHVDPLPDMRRWDSYYEMSLSPSEHSRVLVPGTDRISEHTGVSGLLSDRILSINYRHNTYSYLFTWTWIFIEGYLVGSRGKG